MFKGKTVGFWVGVIATAMMLIADIAFIIVNRGDKTFSWVTAGLILAGVLGEVLVVGKNPVFAPLIPAICYGVALSMHLYLGLPTLSDIVNGVNFVGGNSTAVLVFGGIFLFGTVLAVAASFMGQTEKAK